MTKVAIIGCGVIGAAIAYELSRIPQLNITLIDQNYPASGSTGAALGVLMGAISHKTKGKAWQLRCDSIQRYETLIPELESLTGKQIPFNRQGIVKLLFAEDNLEKWHKLAETRSNQGWQLEIWERTQLQQQCPQIEKNQIIAAVYSPQDRQLNPTILTETLVAAAITNGVDCKFGEQVTTIIPPDQNQTENYHIETTKTTITVDWVVICAGLGSTPLTAALQQSLTLRPVLGQALKFKFDSDLGKKDFQPVITGDDKHIVPLGNGEYWFGATVEFPQNGSDVTAQTELLTQLHQDAIAFCPALAAGKIIQTWIGKRPRPEGQTAPVIEQLPNYPKVLLATGHYRNGVLLAPATAQAITAIIAKT
ncbi:MAG: FAD-dependent oxidoreductase [Stanieria sp.]